jgi:hypothetical protein
LQDAAIVDGIERRPSRRRPRRRSESRWALLQCHRIWDHRGVTALDLNRDQVPYKLKAAFDLVVNAGTTEHVVTQDNAFRVIHDLTKAGGVMLHELPGGGS